MLLDLNKYITHPQELMQALDAWLLLLSAMTAEWDRTD
jgi:hypothetical protein